MELTRFFHYIILKTLILLRIVSTYTGCIRIKPTNCAGILRRGGGGKNLTQ